MAGDILHVARKWEIDGIFGSEYAIENAVGELSKVAGLTVSQLDRRNLRVILNDNRTEMRELVRNIIKIAHGFVESDGPVGELERREAKKKLEKAKALEKKRKRAKH